MEFRQKYKGKEMIGMIEKQCIRNCIFAVGGVCRLKHTQGIDLKGLDCPYREGNQDAISVL